MSEIGYFCLCFKSIFNIDLIICNFTDAVSSSTKEEGGSKQQTLKISLEPMIPRTTTSTTTTTTTALILTTKTTTTQQYVHFYERPPLTDLPEEPDIYSVYNEAFTVGGEKHSYMGTDCSSNPCQDGGTCEDHDGTFTCFCSEKRSGRFCQTPVYSPKLHIPSFSGGGHVLYAEIAKIDNSLIVFKSLI
jgi:hypothetical protein